jgi:catechol 2,3-dioxygenase-like lactoylglutathione lyase family enzyme
MPLQHIEHFLIQTSDMEKTRAWYKRVLGLQDGPAPDFKFPVCWLYIGARDVIHIAEGGANTSENRRRYLGQQTDEVRGSGAVDHIAFRCTGLKETIDRLRKENVSFRQRMVSDQGLYQLFLMDPNDIKIELNFANSEAIESGIKPELTASDLPG